MSALVNCSHMVNCSCAVFLSASCSWCILLHTVKVMDEDYGLSITTLIHWHCLFLRCSKTTEEQFSMTLHSADSFDSRRPDTSTVLWNCNFKVSFLCNKHTAVCIWLCLAKPAFHRYAHKVHTYDTLQIMLHNTVCFWTMNVWSYKGPQSKTEKLPQHPRAETGCQTELQCSCMRAHTHTHTHIHA